MPAVTTLFPEQKIVMDNTRLFLFAALIFVGMLLWQQWQIDYGPQQVEADAPSQAVDANGLAAPDAIEVDDLPEQADEVGVATDSVAAAPAPAEARQLVLVDTDENAFKINSGLEVVWAEDILGMEIPDPLQGWVDDYCVYDNALTSSEVEYLYKGYTCSALPATDFNGDCRVDAEDMVTVIEQWLECQLAPESACP